MTSEIEVRLRPEISELIRGQVVAFRRRREDAADDGLWRLRLAASPDEAVAAEFSELTAATIEAQRVADLDALVEHLDDDIIDLETAHSWIRALNQMRLVIGTDLGVTEEDGWRPAPGDPSFGHSVVYDLLTGLQGWLVEAVSGAEGF